MAKSEQQLREENAKWQRNWREKKQNQGLMELRGLWFKPELHQPIKEQIASYIETLETGE